MTAPIVPPVLTQLNNLPGFPDANVFKLGDYLNQLSGGVAPVAILWQPGGTAGGIVATTWEEVESLLDAQEPKIPTVVYVDTSIDPAVIPATATTDLQNRVTFQAFRMGSASITTVQVTDGGFIKNLSGLVSVRLQGQPTSQPFVVMDNPNNIMVMRTNGGVDLFAGSTAPAIDVLDSFVVVAGFENGTIRSDAGPGQSIIRLTSNIFFILGCVANTSGMVFIPPQTIDGDGTCVLVTSFDSSGAIPTQTFFAGFVVPVPADHAQFEIPSAGSTANRPLELMIGQPQTGQMYFDTDLGLPIWWNGAAWVDATGAPV